MSEASGIDVAVTAQWAATCKDCRAAHAAFERAGGTEADWRKAQRKKKDQAREGFDYPDEWASRTLERGGSRSDRCPECRKRHATKIRAFPVAYIDIAAIGQAEGAENEGGPSGPLGGLGPLPTIHARTASPVNLRQFQLGLNDEIMRTLLDKMSKSQVVVLEAGTGTGKSTLAPFRLMNPPDLATYRPADFGPIIVTEPRIPATTEVARFVGESMCFNHDPAKCSKHIGPGYPVGYQCDGQKAWDDSCRLIYVTDGTMINWIRNGDLARFSVVIIDEAHERSENIDTILALLHQNLRKYPNLRVLIASATLDRDFFLEFFADAANGVDCLTVDAAKSIGYGLPLFPGAIIDDDVLEGGMVIDDVKYEGWRTSVSETDSTNLRDITKTLLELRPAPLPMADLADLRGEDAAVRAAEQAFRIMQSVCAGSIPEGDTIAFLPGENECLKAKEEFESKLEDDPLPVRAYWLMKATEDAEKQLAMAACKPGEYKVIFASNLAETSLTIAGLRYVIDSGLIKQAKWNSSLASSSVPTVVHSRSGVRQRWGRVGRKTYGWVFPLYTLDQFAAMPRDTPAGSTQVNLEQTVLKLIAAGVDDVQTAKFPANFATARRDTAGNESAIGFSAEFSRSVSALKLNGALTADGNLTSLGRELDRSRLSSERTIALMFADRLACMPEVALAMVVLDGGALAGRDGILRADRDWPAAWNVHARRCHEALAVGCSDELDLVLRIFTDWEAAPNPEEWADQWWVDHQRLTVHRKNAFDMVETLAPGMSKRAERSIDLRLARRARAVFSRALRSLQFRREPDGWYSDNPALAPEAVAIPDGLLVSPTDRVIALRRDLPRPRWGQPIAQLSQIQGLINVLPWASDADLEPFQLMIRARQELRDANDELATAHDPCRLLRSAWPVGAIGHSIVEVDGAAVRPPDTTGHLLNRGFTFPGVPRNAGDIEPAPRSRAGKSAKTRTTKQVYSSTSSAFDEANGDFRVKLLAVAGVERPAEEITAESRDVQELEVADDEDLADSVSFANTWQAPDANYGRIRSDDDLAEQESGEYLNATAWIVRGYTIQHDEASVVWEPATSIELAGADPSVYPALIDGDRLQLLAGELVSDHFGIYRVLLTCEEGGQPDGKATFYFDGPLLDEWDSGAAASVWGGSIWEAFAVPGSRKHETRAVALVPTMFTRVASSLGLLSPDGTARNKVRAQGVVVGPQISTRGKVTCIPVQLDIAGATGFSPRVVVPITTAGALAGSVQVGTHVSVEVGPKLKARRSGKWPEDAIERITLASQKLFKSDEQGIHLMLATPAPLSVEARQKLLEDEAARDPDLANQIWQLWTASHHIGALSLQINGAGTLEPEFAAVVHGSTFRSVLDARHNVNIEFEASGRAHIRGTDPIRVTAAMSDMDYLASTFGAVYHLPLARLSNAPTKREEALIKNAVAELKAGSGVLAIHFDSRERQVSLLASDEWITRHAEELLREITDSVTAVVQFPDGQALKRSQHAVRGLQALLEETGCKSARLSSGGKLQWTVEAASESPVARLIDAARSRFAAPGIRIESADVHALTVTRVSGRFTTEYAPPFIDGEVAQSEIVQSRAPLAAAIASGPAELVFATVIDGNGSPLWTPIGPDGPQAWEPIDIGQQRLVAISAVVSHPTAGNPAGHRELFGITSSGRPWHAWKVGEGPWTADNPPMAWQSDGDAPSDLVSVTASSGGPDHVEVFVADTSGHIHHRWWSRWFDETAHAWKQGWSGWTAFGRPSSSGGDFAVRSLSFCPDYDAEPYWRYNLFSTDSVGQIWRHPFVAKADVWWQPAEEVPSPTSSVRQITAVSRTHGHIEMIAICENDSVYSAWSGDNGVTWGAWQGWIGEIGWRIVAAGATLSPDWRYAVHHNLMIKRDGSVAYQRHQHPDPSWQGPVGVDI